MSDNQSDAQILFDPVQRMLCPFCRGRMDVSGIVPFTKAICPGCSREVPVPARLGSFLLLELLGTGGMGGVYRAHDETLGRDVAIKVMLKSLGDNQEFVQSFRREAQAAAKLNHPNIAQIYSFGQEKGQPYIVMELVPGHHLDQLIAQSSMLDPVLVMRIGLEVAEGLQLAAESNLVHGDIKPENILLDERNQAKLVDFGIASSANQGKGEIWGTPYYIAPERVRRQRIDHRSDIYCLGGTLYHALAGRPPFEGPDAIAVVKARFKGPPEPLETIRPDLDPDVVAIVNRMLQVEPAMRYPTYESLLSDLRRYVSRVAPRSAPVAGKRIVFKGRSRAAANAASNGETAPGSATTVAATTSSFSATTRNKTIMVSRGMIPDTLPAQVANDANGGRGGTRTMRGLLIVLGALLGVLMLSALVVVAIRFQRERTARRELAAAGAERARVLASIDKRLASMAAFETAIAALAQQGQAAATQAVALATAELGDALGARIVYEEPEPVAPPDEQAGTTNAPAPAEAEAATNAPAADPVAPADEPPPVAPLAPVAEEPLPLLAQLARTVWLQARPLRQAVARAGQQRERAMKLAAEARAEAAMPRARLLAADETIGALHDELAEELKRAPAAVTQTRKKLAFVQQESDRLAAERKRQAEERERAAAAQRAAAEEQRRLEEERAAAAAEIEQVQAAYTAQLEELGRHRHAEARRALQEVEAKLRTEQGRQAMKLALERVARLESLKEFLVARINDLPFSAQQGWSAERATPLTVTVRTASGKVDEVPWERIKVDQMAPLIQFYLGNEAVAREIRLRERVGQSLNAAVYCMTFGEGSLAAREMAAKLAAKTVDLLPDAKADLTRLLPELAPRE